MKMKKLTRSFTIRLRAVTALASELVDDVCDVGREG